MKKILGLVLLTAMIDKGCHSVATSLAQTPTAMPKNFDSFQTPSVQYRPKFRYWLPDASVPPAAVAADIKSIGSIGAGGVEFLPFYNYGGRVSAPVTDWVTYGYGTPAYNAILKAALQASKESGLRIDLCMGPQSGQGVPASPTDPGLAYDMVFDYKTVQAGETFDGKVPGYGLGQLISVTQADVLTESIAEFPNVKLDASAITNPFYNRTTFKVSERSITDLTKTVKPDGSLSIEFPATTSAKKHIVFAAYYKLNLERAAIPGSGTPQNILQNGSFAVDHFSAGGAKVTTDFLEKYVMGNGVRDLFKQIGNYIWEDSLEIYSTVFWTPKLQATFRKLHSYDIGKYAMLLTHNNGLNFGINYHTAIETDASDKGEGYIEDYRSALTVSMQSYYRALTEWSRTYVNAEFSGQVGYNIPVDGAQIIPEVTAPEDESLGMDETGSGSLDLYRQYVGPSNLAGKRVVSNEMGAVRGIVYNLTLPELLNLVKRSWAVGNNQMVFHGASFSGQYPNTTWPGVTSFSYSFSEPWSRHQPVWENGFSEMNDFIARTQWVLQSGVPQRDVAFWNKNTRSLQLNNSISNNFTDLLAAGYGYEFISPANFELPLAEVKNKILAPDGPSYKSLVLRSIDMLTLLGTEKLVQYAKQGLPIVIQGGIPTTIASAKGLEQAQANIRSMLSLKNVRQVSSGPLAPTLALLGVQPRAKVSNPAWLTYWRLDRLSGTDYIFVYNGGDTTNSGTVTFETNNTPFLLDAWTGSEVPVVEYTVTSSKTITIPFTLAAGDNVLVAFKKVGSGDAPANYVTSAPVKNLGYVYTKGDGISIRVPASAGSGKVTLKDSKTVTIPPQKITPSFTLGNWTLTIESWTPGADFFDSNTIGTKTNQTIKIDALKSWHEIPGFRNSSGVGYYSTSFSWKRSDGGGATIVFGKVQNTIRVRINGKQLPPLNLSDAKADISAYLKEGKNLVEATVATTLYNAVAPIYSSLRSSGAPPRAGPGISVASETRVPAGLLDAVVVTPYNLIRI